MDIRIAVPTDLEGVRQYDRHVPVNRLADCIDRGLVDVLVEDERIVGILRWSLFWQSLPFLDLIYLDESLRSQGWGTKMMAHWEKNMTSQGYQDVMLSTQSDETSKFFYEKLGYRRCGSFLPPDQDAEEWMYRKKL